MNGLGQDFIFATRLIRKRPFAAFVIVATLGLGIGINAAFFASFYGMALRPLPFSEPDELVTIFRSIPEAGESYRPVSEADLYHFREAEALEALAAYDVRLFNLRSEGPAERIRGASVTVDLFPTLGLAPEHGRAFTAQDAVPGAPRVVLIADDLWRRSFGADPSMIGQQIRVDGELAEVVGIMPAGVGFPMYHEMWAPLQTDQASASIDKFGFVFIGRMAAGESVGTVEASLEGVMSELRTRYPDTYEGETVKVRGLRDTWMPPVTQVAALVMQGLASLVLLIVCANVANMVLAQGALRRQEKALRTALGASRGRLVRQSLVENLILAGLGGGLGLLMVLWQGDWLQEISSVPIPYWLNMSIDGPVIAFSLMATLVAGLGVGIVPGLRSVGSRLVEHLKAGGRSDGGTTASEGRLRIGLVVAEYALAVVVLTGALLMVQAYERLQRADTGFAVEERATFKLSFPGADGESESEERLDVIQRALDTVRQLPEVRSATATSFLPIENGPYMASTIEVEGFDFPKSREPRVTIQAVEPDYFETLGIGLVDGRPLTRGDFEDGNPKAVISQGLASRLWPDEGALGRRLRFERKDAPWLEIVGVATNVEPGEPLAGIDRRPADQIYIAMSLTGQNDAGESDSNYLSATPAFILDTSAPLAALAPKVREALAIAEPEVPVFQLRSMETVLRQHYFAQHIWSRMFALIAFVALGIAALGAYGVSAYAVNRRLHEIGIRLALGARPRRLMASVVSRGVVHAAIGLGLGLLLAMPMVGAMGGLLHGAGWSAAVLAGVIGLLAAVSLLATVFPARRAAMVDPVKALRNE